MLQSCNASYISSITPNFFHKNQDIARRASTTDVFDYDLMETVNSSMMSGSQNPARLMEQTDVGGQEPAAAAPGHQGQSNNANSAVPPSSHSSQPSSINTSISTSAGFDSVMHETFPPDQEDSFDEQKKIIRANNKQVPVTNAFDAFDAVDEGEVATNVSPAAQKIERKTSGNAIKSTIFTPQTSLALGSPAFPSYSLDPNPWSYSVDMDPFTLWRANLPARRSLEARFRTIEEREEIVNEEQYQLQKMQFELREMATSLLQSSAPLDAASSRLLKVMVRKLDQLPEHEADVKNHGEASGDVARQEEEGEHNRLPASTLTPPVWPGASRSTASSTSPPPATNTDEVEEDGGNEAVESGEMKGEEDGVEGREEDCEEVASSSASASTVDAGVNFDVPYVRSNPVDRTTIDRAAYGYERSMEWE